MRPIVEAVVAYTRDGAAGELLRDAERLFGQGELRFLCDRLASWWYGELLSDPPWQLAPSLPTGDAQPWHRNLRWLVASVPALGELVACGPSDVHFAEEVSPAERRWLQDWVRANYRPYASVLYKDR